MELSVIENQLLFTLDNSVDRKLELFKKTIDMNALSTKLSTVESQETSAKPVDRLVVCFDMLSLTTLYYWREAGETTKSRLFLSQVG